MTSVADQLSARIQERGRHDPSVHQKPSCVLWTDRERLWEPVIPHIRARLPSLLVLGEYSPLERCGPALWLRALLDGALALDDATGSHSDEIPVVYMPGWSRADLRAITSCPEEIRFIAEFQYRGALFSHPNGRDWTPFAFLSASKIRGGLGLDLASDGETKESLSLALGELLEEDIEQVERRRINAEYLRGLIVTDFNKQVLDWLESPNGKPAAWTDAMMSAFESTCHDKLGWKPSVGGPHKAAAMMTAATEGTTWHAVWLRYLENMGRYRRVYALLLTQRPKDELFVDESRFPSRNAEAEKRLRTELAGLPPADPAAARDRLRALEAEHGQRRSWPWARLGACDLARALEPLAELALLAGQGGGGTDLAGMARAYEERFWRTDAAALESLGRVGTKEDREAVSHALRAVYLPWLEEHSARAQSLGIVVFPREVLEKEPSYEADTCLLFIDGLRYDLGRNLAQSLESRGRKVRLRGHWSAPPSVTSVGKYLSSPACGIPVGLIDDGQPGVAVAGGPVLDAARHRSLLAEAGIAFLRSEEVGTGTGLAWTEEGEIDRRGHEVGARVAGELDSILGWIVERVDELLESGWSHVRIVTDHGWLLVPGGLPVAGLPASLTLGKWGRSGLLSSGAPDVPGAYVWPLNPSVRLTTAPGARNYREGVEYAHGGFSFQESFLPDILVQAQAGVAGFAEIVRIKWSGLRCEIEIKPHRSGLYCDARLAAMKPETSVAAAQKAFKDGKASIVVVRDDLEGHAAVLVVVDESGGLIAQETITIGG